VLLIVRHDGGIRRENKKIYELDEKEMVIDERFGL
jgi:hypothetical protein